MGTVISCGVKIVYCRSILTFGSATNKTSCYTFISVSCHNGKSLSTYTKRRAHSPYQTVVFGVLRVHHTNIRLVEEVSHVSCPKKKQLADHLFVQLRAETYHARRNKEDHGYV